MDASHAIENTVPSSRPRLWALLGGMMFLEYAVWGSWMPILSATLFARGVPGTAIGGIYGALYLALIFTPFLGGQIADRWLPSQYLLAITHLLGAGAAFVLAQQTTSGGLFLWMLIWALLFAPSLGVTNSIALHHIDRLPLDEAGKEREFSVIRTAGTLGWIIAAFLLLAYMSATHADPAGKIGPLPEMQLAGILGIAMAVFSLLLPHTPPARQGVDPLAFRKAFGLFKSVPGFTVFMLISFVAATEFQFFYVLSGPFLENGAFTQIPLNLIAPVKAISQAMEIIALAVLLPIFLPKKGMRWCLLVGSFAWPLRYVIFAMGKPAWLVVASLALHGFGYAFVLVVQQIYVDRVAARDIRSSAQNLLNVVTLGVGNYLGSIFCGKVLEHYTVGGTTNWPPVFLLPTITTLVCAFAYMFTFRDIQAHSAAPDEALPENQPL